jgi:hypothetical protein
MNAPSLLISLVSATMTPLSAIMTTGHFTLTLVSVRRSVVIVVTSYSYLLISLQINRVQPPCHIRQNLFSLFIGRYLTSVRAKQVCREELVKFLEYWGFASMGLEFRIFLKYRLRDKQLTFNQMKEGIFLWKPWHFSD